ncbi:hypothetical protein [Alteraurantiacibacter aquimixticola]|uniref:Uncharacterized protein n=1 Tax=Alteraurantiacibacter aquimixticola TaxID=2489173 RepID=A0A4T3F4B8_9SPHN|nr:hypothetical protein [Alteraurantiacibacter aquimixticola]TIX51289.1 hypothetical protein E5222_02150 [Alteraurantiacibacter aquimixticola]
MSRDPQSRAARRGQPVLMLVLLVLGWASLRAATWASPLPADGSYGRMAGMLVAVEEEAARESQRRSPSPPVATTEAPEVPFDLFSPVAPSWSDPALTQMPPGHSDRGDSSLAGRQVSEASLPASPRMAAGHALLMAAGLSQMEVPPQIAALYREAELRRQQLAEAEANPLLAAASVPDAAPYGVALPTPSANRRSRWSADGWLLWREDTTTPFTSGRPSYGRSQLGAVVRYELAPSNGRRPQAYVRGSAALNGASEREVAAGLSARPLARIPIRVAAEARLSDRPESREVRPAAYTVTELPPVNLPLGLRGEAYAQAGYVGGDYATPFADGQARVDRSFASTDDFDLRAGGAVWGGAQEDGERLDVGPSASVTFRLGGTRGRVAADYRFRVAGNAEPASGPALTLSAGF